MKTYKIALITLAMLAAVAAAAFSAQIDFYNYQQFGGAWSDANKTWTTDTNMCWAASSSNVLAWTGWTTASSPTTAADIFAYYKNHWSNLGGNPYYAWKWWFSGINDMQGHTGWSQVIVPGGDFFPGENIDDYFNYQNDTTQAMASAYSYLRADYGVALGLATSGGGGHSITGWGVRYDTSTGQYLGVYVTDSDDNQTALKYYGVALSGGKWYLQNYFGSSANWYISEVEGLARPDATYWTGTSGGWSSGQRWQNGVPTSATTAFIGNNTTVTISTAAACANLYVGYESGASYAGIARINTGGSLTIANSLYLGLMNGATGTFTINAGPLSAGSEYIGDGGAGTLTQNGSTNTLGGTLYVGYSTGGSGTYNLSSGQLNVNTGGSIRIGADGATGQFTWTGGTVSAPKMVLGSNGALSAGTGVTLLLSTSGGIGRLDWLGGTITTPNMTLDSTATLAMGFDFNVGNLASGALFSGGGAVSGLSLATLEIENGATATENSAFGVRVLNLGGISSVGKYTLTSGALTIGSGGSIRVGADGGTGLFAWYGGTIDTPSMVLGTNSTLVMGFNFDMGSLTSGSIFLHGGSLTGLPSGTLEITNNAVATQSTNISGPNVLRIGSSSGSGAYSMTGGQLSISAGGSIRIGADGVAGQFTWTGGTVSAPKMVLGANATLSAGTGVTLLLSASGGIGRLEWFGGTIATPNMTLDSTATLAMGYNFNVVNLASGALFSGGGAVSGLSSATLEIANGATATENSGVFSVRTLRIGGSSSFGTYTLAAGQLIIPSDGSIRVGADGSIGRFAWSGGTLDTPLMVLGANGTLAMRFNFDMGSLTSGSLFLHGGSLTGLSSGALEITSNAVAAQSTDISGPKLLRLGSSGGGGTYIMTGGQLSIGAGGSIRIGADNGVGRFAWYGGTINTPSMVLGANGTLAMGYDFNIAPLMSGGLFTSGGTLTGLASGTLEITNGATATQNTSVAPTIKKLMLGSASGSGKHTLSAGQLLSGAGGSIRVGADGGAGRFEWFGGTVNTPSLVLGNAGTLAMGFNFSVANLVNGSLFGGALAGMNSATLEITRGVVATQDSSSVLNVHDLHVGGATGGGTYSLRSGQLNVDPAGSVVVGADGAPGRFEWRGGSIDTADFVLTPWNSTLLMGFNFNVGALTGGSIFTHGGVVEGLNTSTLEVYNGATATQGSADSLAASVLMAGTAADGAGYYVMNGGSISAAYEGSSGGGIFTLNDGTNDIYGGLGIGYENGSSGTFAQNGGRCIVEGSLTSLNGLYVGFGGGTGTYNLQNGDLWVYTDAYIGYSSSGLFHQTGGSNITQDLYLGYQWVGGPVWTGTYTLENGSLIVGGMEYVGYQGVGVFNQSGGTNTVTQGLGGLAIGGGGGPYEGGLGTYNLSGGVLTVSNTAVGYYGNGTFVQTGGIHKSIGFGIGVGFGPGTVGNYQQSAGSTTIAGTLWLGFDSSAQGTYTLSGTGQLAAGTEYVGYYGSGTFNQSGGTHTVTDTLNIGYSGAGVFNLSGGSLTAKNVIIGPQGTWNITSSAAATKITGMLSFSAGANYSAVPAVTIEMTGARLDINGTVEAVLAGLAATEFVFDGGTAVVSQVEVAGLAGGGFTNNFAVGALTLGNGTSAGVVQFLDQRNNGNRGASGKESLFAGAVFINTGSWLDMHGYSLYVSGNAESLLDGYIADSRLRDTTLGGGYYLDAVYDPAHSWTTVAVLPGGSGYASLLDPQGYGAAANLLSPALQLKALGASGDLSFSGGSVIPEPGTIIMFGFGLIGLLGIARRTVR